MSTYWISLHGDDCGSVKWQSIGIILNLYDLVPIRRYPIINTNDDYVYYVCWCIYAYDLPPAFNEITYWSLICPFEDIQESFKNPLSVLLSINLVENINTHHYDINTNRWIRKKILKQYKIQEHFPYCVSWLNTKYTYWLISMKWMKPLYICIIILIIQYLIQPPRLHRYTLSNLQFDNRRHPMQPWPNPFQPACNSIQPSSGNVATIVILGTKLSATIVTWSALFWWPVQRILNWRIRDTASIFPCVAFIYSIYH